MIRIWDAKTKTCEAVLAGHDDSVNSVAFSSDNKKIVRGHHSSVNSVAFSSDNKKFVSGSYDCSIRIWDAETKTCEATQKGYESGVNSVAFSSDNTKIVC